MATTRRKKASGIGTAIYVVILILWILFLAACGLDRNNILHVGDYDSEEAVEDGIRSTR